jgi:electron transfer flavoprotein alpha subunit
LFPDIVTGLIRTHRPSIALFPSSEAGRDLAPRLAQRFSTGLTTHCTELEIIDSDEHGKGLLLMKRPGFSGNMMASMICPHRRPQMATVQPGVFEKKEFPGRGTETIEVGFPCGDFESRISSLEAPLRWDTPRVPLEQSPVIIAGGRGIGSSKGFGCLAELADLLGGEVGATRVPVFNGWCGEERMIGQTGKTVRPRLYMGFGVSGQLQHTASIIDSEIIISVNIDRDAPINEISDYVLHEDAGRFLSGLIAHLKEIMVRKA